MTDPTEIWLPIPGFPDYDVSDLGRVRSWKTGRGGGRAAEPYVMVPRPDSDGYLLVNLYRDGRMTTCKVHSLVLAAFRGPPEPSMQCLHHDNDKANVRLENLRWGTPKENADDMRRHGTHAEARKTHCKRGHEFTPENTYRNASSGARVCRECARGHDRKRNPRKRQKRQKRW